MPKRAAGGGIPPSSPALDTHQVRHASRGTTASTAGSSRSAGSDLALAWDNTHASGAVVNAHATDAVFYAHASDAANASVVTDNTGASGGPLRRYQIGVFSLSGEESLSTWPIVTLSFCQLLQRSFPPLPSGPCHRVLSPRCKLNSSVVAFLHFSRESDAFARP